MFVVTIDQRGSRGRPDRVPELLKQLAATGAVRGFERTAGDEVQGVLDDAGAVVDVVLRVVRAGGWSTGVGAGPVRALPPSARAGSGPAFELARAAVDAAKASPTHLALRGADEGCAAHAEAVLRLLADVVARRTRPGWQVVDLLDAGRSQGEAAQELGITRQAVSQRALVAGWLLERDARPAAAALVAGAAGDRR